MVKNRILSRDQLAVVLAGPWSIKLFYLGYFASMGIYLPYIGLYLGAIGLDGTEIGLITSMFPLAGVIVQPVWGMLSDLFDWRKRLLVGALLTAVLTSLALFLIHSFGMLLLLIILLAVAFSPAIPLMDAITLQWIGDHGGSYGVIRVYGSLGFLITAIVAGTILNVVGIPSLFLLLTLILISPLLASLFVPGQSKAEMARAKWQEVLFLLRNRTLLLFIICCAIGYSTFAAYNTFFGLYLRDLGVNTAAIGLAAGLATLSELPVMAFSGVLIKRFGTKWFLLIGLSVALVRWFAYAAFPRYDLLFAFTLLHGISFAGFYVAGVTFIDRRVPQHLRTTGQTLFYGATFGVGTFLGNNLFGALYQRLHGGRVYVVAGGICAFAILCLLLVMPHETADRRSNPLS